MIYLMSDIHGESNRFFEMLDLIQFSPIDHLYILGDIVDRGPDGIHLIQYIMEQGNISVIIGNHEYMFYDAVINLKRDEKLNLWMRNGGYATFMEYLELSSEKQNQILEFIRNLPDHLIVNSRGQNIMLVHGSPGETTEEKIWSRPSLIDLPLLGDTVVVVGHTPTIFFKDTKGNPLSIYYDNKFIGLDCGCGHSTPLKRLACLRLDDMKEFYV